MVSAGETMGILGRVAEREWRGGVWRWLDRELGGQGIGGRSLRRPKRPG